MMRTRSLTALLLGLACSPQAPAADDTTVGPSTPPASAAATAEPWYRRGRALDLTGDGTPDSVQLVATGTRPDSLRIALSLLVAGEKKHREEWGSSYELVIADSADRRRSAVDSLLRARLDSVLASVVVQRLDAPGVRLMAEDHRILAGLTPRPTHRVSFSYGYESTTRLVWDASSSRFVPLWSCC
jgi:hypothetical protein